MFTHKRSYVGEIQLCFAIVFVHDSGEPVVFFSLAFCACLIYGSELRVVLTYIICTRQLPGTNTYCAQYILQTFSAFTFSLTYRTRFKNCNLS